MGLQAGTAERSGSVVSEDCGRLGAHISHRLQHLRYLVISLSETCFT